MEEIIPRLYVGNDQDYENNKDREGFCFVRCCKYGPGGHQQTLGYHTLAAPEGKNKYTVRRGNLLALNILDLDDPNFIPKDMIDSALSFIGEKLGEGKKVLVACNHGHSRGPSIALMYLRSIGEMPHSFVWAEKIYRVLYPEYNPNQGIRQWLRMNW
jgi:hypothetical protein